MNDNCVVLAGKHQNILEGIRGLLDNMFSSVLMVVDEQSLVEALSKLKPQIAIVDISLLGQSDLMPLKELHKKFPGAKIIVLSDYDELEVVKDVMSSGLSGYILKQYVGVDLHNAIEHIRKGHIFISPVIKNIHELDTKNGL